MTRSKNMTLFAVGALALLAFAAVPAQARLGGSVLPVDNTIPAGEIEFMEGFGPGEQIPDIKALQAAFGARKLSGKRCGSSSGEAACIAACASLVGMPVCLSDACYGPNGPDFSCGK